MHVLSNAYIYEKSRVIRLNNSSGLLLLSIAYVQEYIGLIVHVCYTMSCFLSFRPISLLVFRVSFYATHSIQVRKTIDIVYS